ncbi:MAG: hypothetical protein ABEJ74_04455 [Haloferacaceae archaeon]
MNCPVCLFAGTMEEVRAHLAVQGRVDDPHADWLADHGIDLDDETQASVGELTYVLSRRDDDGGPG